ncbi:MAG: hypothetical protein AB7O38_21400 [Pirellulaceae bacterium]
MSEIGWDADHGSITNDLMKHVEEWSAAIRERIATDSERLWTMTDEPGQVALYAETKRAAELDALHSKQARAMFAFLHEPEAFRRAECDRLIDVRRFARMWAGIRCRPGVDMPLNGPPVEQFRTEVQAYFKITNTHVEIYERSRPRLGVATARLFQANIYQEDKPDEQWMFDGGCLSRRMHRPVAEAAVTYEPETGRMEVVTSNREARPVLLKLCCEHLLGIPHTGEWIEKRLYNLQSLAGPRTFPTDPADGIVSVEVVSLRLAPFNRSGFRITLESPSPQVASLWEETSSWFGRMSALERGWQVTQAKLVIKFRADRHAPKGKRLSVTITMPRSCDLKDRTEHERLIAERYLRQWGLIDDR